MRPRNIYIGHDARERTAYRVCERSIIENTRRCTPIIQPISSQTLGPAYYRPTHHADGVLWDDISGAPMATEFSLARFFVPFQQTTGWALFCDCDFLFRADIEGLFSLADDKYAVMCVKHEHVPKSALKMDGQVQTTYERKNWSSLFLINCAAPEVRRFSVIEANSLPGRDLHQFLWLRNDERIGELPADWNYLVGVSDRNDHARGVHFTLGTPDMDGYENQQYADEWRAYAGG